MKPWSEMDARKRDALVAEKVMGYEVAHGVQCIYECGSDIDIGIAATRFDMKSRGDVVYDPVPEYSTQIGPAWKVVDKMGDTWFHLARFSKPGPQWRAQFGTSDDGAYADTVPEAICLAALRAKGVEV